MKDTQELIHIRTAARLLDVSKRTVYRLVESGRLKALRPTPHTTRIIKSSVEAIINDPSNF